MHVVPHIHYATAVKSMDDLPGYLELADTTQASKMPVAQLKNAIGTHVCMSWTSFQENFMRQPELRDASSTPS